MWSILFLLPLLLAYGEQIPDYNNPYAPIMTDKQVYTWTDKVVITIIAPSWNSDRYLVDSIGGTRDHAIVVSTGDNSLEEYQFAETGANSGIFRAEVTLTGFEHDANGDGDIDTNPMTSGSGPTGGFLEADRDSAVTITFEFADGVILSESVPISWNLGTVSFEQSGDSASVRVADPDMNLNPNIPDSVSVRIATDSGSAGITIRATETTPSSGVFAADLVLSETAPSSGNRIHAPPGSQLTARYDDHTLPEPHSESDRAKIEATATVGPVLLPTERMSMSPVIFTNGLGGSLQSLSAGVQAQMVGTLSNNQLVAQDFAYIFQVRNSAGSIEALSWVLGSLLPGDSLDVSQSWMPSVPGTFTVESFVWKSITNSDALAPSTSVQIAVE
ncbi:MAG: hypothetical protein D9C04_05730 [Nitrosopumilus sp. B06]|nr:MAG: hypothetical protein D9C04_05730 [Nitrosopumilus sp. B06]